MNTKEYNKVVEQFSNNVYRFALSLSRNTHIAEDVVQDSFERLWIHHGEIAFEKARSFLFSTAHNRTIDIFRKEKRMIETDEFKSDASVSEDQYSDLKEVLNEAVGKLNDIQRSVVLLRDYEGYTYQDIAEVTGLTESQVKVYIFRARKFLKQYIGTMQNVL
jgi:RNA polymerase sigma-70 factor (ECF subfamily)